MDNNSGVFDIPDSTDWLHTPLASFEPLEAALRCQVCKDFYDTPMLTTCSHTFCSLCIRRCFAADSKCPTCRASDQANKLRRNWVVQEIVDAFQAARAVALKLALEAAEAEAGRRTGGKKRKLDEADLEDREPEDGSRARRTRSRRRRADEASSPPELVDLEEGGEDAENRPDDGLVKCPICSRRMKEEAVYSHLDQCDGETKSTSGRSTRSRSVAPARNLQQPATKETSPAPARIPQLNYSLLKDNAFRKKLQDLGIPSWGSRQLLTRRHVEWVNLWNSNCDSARPRSKRELLKELETWERSQGGSAPNTAAAVIKKDFDSQGWASSNKDQFDALIADARRKRGTPVEENEKGEARDETMKMLPKSVESIELSPGSNQQVDVPRRYEGNKDALSIIRENVGQASRNGFAPRSLNQAPEPTSQRNGDSAITNGESLPDAPEEDGVPASFESPTRSQTSRGPPSSSLSKNPFSSPTRKLPMFQVPKDPVADMDSGTTGC